MVDNQFFDEPREQSQIKARIVEKYLWAWANVVIPYKRALIELEAKKKIRVEPPATERPKKKGETTFADHVRVTFPRKK